MYHLICAILQKGANRVYRHRNLSLARIRVRDFELVLEFALRLRMVHFLPTVGLWGMRWGCRAGSFYHMEKSWLANHLDGCLVGGSQPFQAS